MAVSPLIVMLAGACAAVVRWALRRVLGRRLKRGLPDELARGRVVLAESRIRCAKPVPMHGAPDEVWQAPDGALIVVETKTRDRARVHRSDVVQLSAYRVMLLNGRDRRVGGLPVKPYGYVRIVHGRQTTWRRVELLSEQQIIGLWRRYQAVMHGRIAARGARYPGLCRTCGHANRCSVRPAGSGRAKSRNAAHGYAAGRQAGA